MTRNAATQTIDQFHGGRARRRERGIRGAVQTAVAAAHAARPEPGAAAGEQAVWWHHNASALDLIAENEADEARAEAARSDAEIARRLSRGLALTHADAVERDATAEVAELQDDSDELEVSWP